MSNIRKQATLGRVRNRRGDLPKGPAVLAGNRFVAQRGLEFLPVALNAVVTTAGSI